MVARAEAAAATARADARRRVAALLRAARTRSVRLADVAADAGVTVQTAPRPLRHEGLSCSSPHGRWTIGPEGARRDTAPVGDVRTAVRLLYDSYELRGDAALHLLAEEDRIPAVREMTDSRPRLAPRVGRADVRAAARRPVRGASGSDG